MNLLPVKALLVASLAMVAAGLCIGGCKKQEKAKPASPHPQSAAGVMLAMIQQGNKLTDAAARNDFDYVHDYSDYFQQLAEAFSRALNDNQKQQVSDLLAEIKTVTDQLDHTAGRKQAEATQASMGRLMTVLKELEKRFQKMLQDDPGLSRRAENVHDRADV